jgi:hypothetical protein
VNTAVLLAGSVSVVALAAGCGGESTVSSTVSRATPAVAQRLLERRLAAMQLDYTWVACVNVGRTYKHVPITRCNVGFGIDPHVEGYCVVLMDGKLVTNHDHPAIPCRHDDAGWDRTVITSS